MYFWPVFFCDLLIPAIQLISGFFLWKFPPKKINSFYGYRSSRSMKNIDTWNFAHRYSGRIWFFVGLVSLPVYALLHIPFYSSAESTLFYVSLVVLILQCVSLFASIFPTEAALRKAFNDDGERIEK